MVDSRLASFLRRLSTAFALQDNQGLTDQELLRAFTGRQDEAAFTRIVRRHGQMVLGVCRHVLGHEQEAEDAFQATFLVLAKRAGSICRQEALSSWLFGVAHRTAQRARRLAVNRRRREEQCAKPENCNCSCDGSLQEIQAALEEEIHRLPEKYRAPFILCFLEGKSREETARELGCKEGTVSSRLARARKKLQKSLARRGIALSSALAAAAISPGAASGAMPLGLMTTTATGALSVALYGTGAVAAEMGGLDAASPSVTKSVLSAKVIMLAEGMVKTMLLTKLVLAGFLVLALVVGAGGVGLLAVPMLVGNKPGPAARPPKAAGQDGSQKSSNTGAQQKDNATPLPQAQEILPKGAWARLGTARFADTGRPLSLAFSADGSFLMEGSWDGAVIIWDPLTKKSMREWDSQSGPVRAVAVSPDGSKLASAGTASGFRLWQRGNGELWKTVGGQVEPENQHFETGGGELLEVSPDGRRLVSASYGGTNLRLWDLTTARAIYSRDRRGFPAFSMDGSSLLVACWEVLGKSTDRVPCFLTIDAQTGKETNRRPLPTASLPAKLFPAEDRFSLSSCGRWLVHLSHSWQQGGPETTIWLTDVAGGRISKLHETAHWDGAPDFAFSSDERYLAYASPDQEVLVFELSTGQIRCRFRRPEGGKASLGFSPDGRSLACGSLDRTVLLWDLTGRMVDGTLQPTKLTPKEMAHLWTELDAAEGSVINRAFWELASGGKEAVAFLEKQIPVSRPVDAAKLADLLRDLASDSYQVRAKATREIEDFHDSAEPFIRKKLAEPLPLEVQRRLEQLLEKIDQWWAKQPKLVRAVEILERSTGAEARELLARLSADEGNLRLAKEAKAALRRLNRTKT